MTSATSKKIAYIAASQFKESFYEPSPTVGYIFIGNHLAYTNENAPPIIIDSIADEKDSWDNMIAAKKITGDNTLTGDITGFANQSWGPTSNIQIRGNNSISGSFANLPNIPTIWIMNGKINNSLYNTAYITTGNTITGALTLQSNQNDIIIGGANTISGSLTGTTVYTGATGRMSRLVIGGNNTINGTMSQLRTPNTFIIAGNNTISGDLSQMNKVRLNLLSFKFSKC